MRKQTTDMKKKDHVRLGPWRAEQPDLPRSDVCDQHDRAGRAASGVGG